MVRRLHILGFPILLATMSSGIIGCSDTMESGIAGSYTLASVTGRGPTAGSFTLAAKGAAERRATYGVGTSASEYIDTGTYTVAGDSIYYALRQSSGL